MDPSNRARLVEATEMAHRWHATQLRKGTDIPYISHLVQVEGLVLEHGGDVDQAISALLHDAIEDAETPDEGEARAREIELRFGACVLAMVRDCTDTGPGEAGASKRPWRERKERYLAHLDVVSDRSLLVAVCDKLHNLNAIVWDVSTHGVGYLERFNAGPEEQLWYFEGVIEKAEGRVPKRLVAEFRALFDRLRKLVA